jgi:uncharacterized protein YecE (DUF72 family)
MLAYYATHFPLVELNFTYYRLPTPQDLDRQLKKAPAGFQFLVKLHQSFTHDDDWAQVGAFQSAISVLANAGSLAGLLCQYPQRFHRTTANEDRLVGLAEKFPGHTYAVEFRHQSWAGPEVLDWLGRQGIVAVSVDAPAIANLYPSGLVQSNRLIYVRFHSRRASSWYEGDKERYDYDYHDDELREWRDALVARRHAADKALLLFNNCRRSHAAENARRMGELLAEAGCGGNVVGPFAQAPPGDQQRRLF